MNKHLKSYLKKSVSKISDPVKRKSAYLELRSHVFDLMENEVREDLSEEQKAKMIIKRLPTAKDFSRKLQYANRPWYWRYPLLTLSMSGTVLTAFVIILGSHIFVTEYLKPQLEQNVIPDQRIVDYMLRDLEYLDKVNIFPRTTRTKNAAELLNKYLGGVDSKGRDDQLQVVQKLLQKYHSWKTDPSKLKMLLSDSELMSINTSWILELNHYDHVDFTKLSGISSKIQGAHFSNSIEKISTWASMPIIEISNLRTWYSLFVLQMHKRGKTEQGLSLAKKISGLVQSNGLLVDHMVALSILKDQRLFAELLNSNNIELTPLPTLEAYKRVSWAWPGVINRSYHEGRIPTAFQKYAKKELGLCAGVGEYFMGFQGMSDFLYPEAPFETSFRPQLKAAKTLAADLLKKCDRHEEFKPFLAETPEGKNKIWEENMIEVWSMAGPIPFKEYLPNPSRIPYVRRVVIYFLMSVAIPSYTNLYMDLIKKEGVSSKNAANSG